MATDDEHPNVTNNPRKRKINGKKRENDKKMRLSSHTTGDPCKCTRLQCFEKLSVEARKSILDRFNELNTKDELDAMIAACITYNTLQCEAKKIKEGG